MLREPGFERLEIEDEAGNDSGHLIDARDLDYALALRRAQAFDRLLDPVTGRLRSIDVVHHDHGARCREGVKRADAALCDLLQDLVPFVEFGAGHG